MSQINAAKVGEVVAKLYHHLLGSSIKEQQAYALELLRQAFDIQYSCWAMIDIHTGVLDIQSLGFANKHRRRFERAINNQMTQLDFAHALSLADYAERLLAPLLKLKLSEGRLCGYHALYLDKEIHLLLSVAPHQPLAHSLLPFLFDRFVHSLKLNRFTRYHNDRVRPNSYKAICDKNFRVVEAEKHFFELIETCSPQYVCDQQLSDELRHKLSHGTAFCLDDVVYHLSDIDEFVCIEIYFDDPRIKRLAPKRQQVLKLIYLDREEIAKRLAMSIRTLDDHFAAIYDEFGTREKKKILAETHQFPQVEKIRQSYR